MSRASFLFCIAFGTLLLACSADPPPATMSTSTPLPPVAIVLPEATPQPTVVYEDGCPVTEPNGAVPPGEDQSRARNVLGNGELWVGLYPQGTVVFEPGGPGSRSDLDGSLGMKFWWWRAVLGKLEITGKRLDGDAPPMWGEVPEGYGDSGFQAAGLVFPTPGCWEVTGRVGDASITFVTRVVSHYPPLARYEVGDVSLATCPVTKPNGIGEPSPSQRRLAHGTGGLVTYLWPAGRVILPPDGLGEMREDGSVAIDWLWVRTAAGELAISGRRLDQPAPPLVAEIPEGFGEIGSQPSVLIFPTPGCWEITARVGDHGMVFVTLLESLY